MSQLSRFQGARASRASQCHGYESELRAGEHCRCSSDARATRALAKTPPFMRKQASRALGRRREAPGRRAAAGMSETGLRRRSSSVQRGWRRRSAGLPRPALGLRLLDPELPWSVRWEPDTPCLLAVCGDRSLLGPASTATAIPRAMEVAAGDGGVVSLRRA